MLSNSTSTCGPQGASTVLLAGRPEPHAVLDTIERFKPTLFFGLPTLYNALLHHARIDSADLLSVRLCLSAAEVLSLDIFNIRKLMALKPTMLALMHGSAFRGDKVGAIGALADRFEARLRAGMEQ